MRSDNIAENPSPLTRRDLIFGSLGAGLAPSLGRLERILAPAPFSFSFFSDTHVGLTTNIEENRRMFAEMATLGLDFGVNGGDVTDSGWARQYENYWNLIKGLPFRVHHVPGNHDVRWSPLGPKAYTEGTRDPMYGSFTHKGCHFALLDSTVPLSHWGHFESSMLRWLKRDLERIGPDMPLFVFMHHWIGRDTIMVDNELELLDILEPYNVKVLCNAHGHSDLLWTWEGIQSTMNKGLYQLSYERIDVGADAVKIFRRTEQHPQMRQIAELPLARQDRHRTRSSQWVAAAEGMREARVDDGAWAPVPPSEPKLPIAGEHRVSFRKGPRDYWPGLLVESRTEDGPIRLLWETPLTGGVMSHVRLDSGSLFISAMDGSLTQLDASTGKIDWRSATRGYCHSSPKVLADRVVVGSSDGKVRCFRRSDGKPLWSFGTGGPVYASAEDASRVLCAASGDGFVYGLNPEDGSRIWSYEIPRSNTSFVQSPIATDGTRFFLGAWDSHLYALNAKTGELEWRSGCCADKSFAYSAAIGGPAVGDGKVFVPADGNVLYCFDASTGNTVWQVSSPGDKFGYSGPCLVDGRLYVGCLGDKGQVRCVDAKDGSILWVANTGSVIYDSSPCVSGGLVAVGSVIGLLSVIRAADGGIAAQYQLPIGHFLSSPASEGRRIYAATYSDRAMAFEIRPD